MIKWAYMRGNLLVMPQNSANPGSGSLIFLYRSQEAVFASAPINCIHNRKEVDQNGTNRKTR